MTTALGHITSAETVQQGMIDLLKLWLPQYLCEADEEEGRERGKTAWPKSWQHAPRFNNELLKQLPAMLVICPGTVDKPVKEGDGYYRVSWSVGVSALVKGQDEATSSAIAKRYGAAIQGAVMQRKGSIHPRTHGCSWDGEKYDEIASSQERTMAVAVQFFTVEISKVFSDKLGPVKEPPKEEPTKEEFEPGPIIPDEDHISVTIIPKES